MGKFADELIASMKQAAAHAEGSKVKGVRITKREVPNLKAIRRPDIWAPEELLVGSLNTCMMLTFLALAQARGLIPVGYEGEAEGVLENVEGRYHITEVTVRPRVTLKGEAELEPARKTMESVEAHCLTFRTSRR